MTARRSVTNPSDFVFDVDAIAPNDRIHPSEGYKLKCCGVNPSRETLRNWMRRGVVVNGERVLLPTDRNPKRYTTVAAYRWWRDRLNALDRLGDQ